MKKILLVSTFAIPMLLSGCIKPYIVDVQQGNYIDKAALSSLHPGMSKNQVRDAMGTPMLDTAFDQDCWLYVYIQEINGKKVAKQKVSICFQNDALVSINSNS